MATSTTIAEGAHDHPRGLKRFLFSTNHKDIGTLYIILGAVGGIIAYLMSAAMRAELAQPGVQVFPVLAQILHGADAGMALDAGKKGDVPAYNEAVDKRNTLAPQVDAAIEKLRTDTNAVLLALAKVTNRTAP